MRALVGVALAAAVGFSVPANAAPLVVGDGYKAFYFGDTGSSIYDPATNDTQYTFTLTSAAKLQITDAYVPGDVFEFFLNGVSLGNTSTPNGDDATDNDPEIAAINPAYTHGTYLLDAGFYTLTGIATSSPSGEGAAFIGLAAAVPEPATWAMMVLGFGVVGAAMRKRQLVAVSYA